MNSYQTIKAQSRSSPPYTLASGVCLENAHEGSAIAHLASQDAVDLAQKSQSGGAVVALADVASAAAVVSLIEDDARVFDPQVSVAEITYYKAAKAPLIARVELSRSPDDLRSAMAHENEVSFAALVDVRNPDDERIADMRMEWIMRPKVT